MSELAKRRCLPCRAGAAPMGPAEAARLLPEVPGWELAEGATRLRRRFRFRAWADAFAFVAAISALAEAENHHPDLAFGWGYCEVVFYTHRIGGLAEADFIAAAKVGELAEGRAPTVTR